MLIRVSESGGVVGIRLMVTVVTMCMMCVMVDRFLPLVSGGFRSRPLVTRR